MSNNHNKLDWVTVFDEPGLEFAGGNVATDPHDGLSLFGSYSTSKAHFALTHIVLGSKEGLDLWNAWAVAMNGPAAIEDSTKHRLWPPYPGFDVCFSQPWPERAERTYEIDRQSIIQASRKRDAQERCYAVVEHFLAHFPTAKKLDASPQLAICVIPDEVWMNCRPQSRVLAPVDSGISRQQKESRRAGQSELFETFAREQYNLSQDFRRQLKARTMGFDIPVQIIRESTLRLSDEIAFGARRLTPYLTECGICPQHCTTSVVGNLGSLTALERGYAILE